MVMDPSKKALNEFFERPRQKRLKKDANEKTIKDIFFKPDHKFQEI